MPPYIFHLWQVSCKLTSKSERLWNETKCKLYDKYRKQHWPPPFGEMGIPPPPPFYNNWLMAILGWAYMIWILAGSRRVEPRFELSMAVLTWESVLFLADPCWMDPVEKPALQSHRQSCYNKAWTTKAQRKRFPLGAHCNWMGNQLCILLFFQPAGWMERNGQILLPLHWLNIGSLAETRWVEKIPLGSWINDLMVYFVLLYNINMPTGPNVQDPIVTLKRSGLVNLSHECGFGLWKNETTLSDLLLGSHFEEVQPDWFMKLYLWNIFNVTEGALNECG